MGDTISAKPVDVSSIDLSWLVGRSVSSCSFSAPDFWMIALSGGGHVSTQSIWRLLTVGGMPVCSEDHGQQFGLPAPVDAAASAMSELSTAVIIEASINSSAPDLLLRFESGRALEVLATSTGFECWQVCSPSGLCTVVSGNRSASAWLQEKSG